MARAKTPTSWTTLIGTVRNRVRELRFVPARELIPNDKNWRRHPETQRRALSGVLREVGYADALLARETPDGLQLLDGHLRAETTPEAEVPVLVVDLTDEEADLVLATHDPIAALAQTDAAAFDALTASMQVEDEELADALAALRSAGAATSGGFDPATAAAGGAREIEPPSEFASYDEHIPTEHACPKCGFRWSGGQG
jgi:hypothetical protein